MMGPVGDLVGRQRFLSMEDNQAHSLLQFDFRPHQPYFASPSTTLDDKLANRVY